MNSEQSAYLTASQRHHRFMGQGKKQRYIEVFQCSGEDMNIVLTGGISTAPLSPAVGKSGPSNGVAGNAATLLSPGMLNLMSNQPHTHSPSVISQPSLPSTPKFQNMLLMNHLMAQQQLIAASNFQAATLAATKQFPFMSQQQPMIILPNSSSPAQTPIFLQRPPTAPYLIPPAPLFHQAAASGNNLITLTPGLKRAYADAFFADPQQSESSKRLFQNNTNSTYLTHQPATFPHN